MSSQRFFRHPIILGLGFIAVLKSLGLIEIDFSNFRRDD